MSKKKQIDLHGGLAFCEWDGDPDGPVHSRLVEVVSQRGNLQDHDGTVKLAWKFADAMASDLESQGLSRKTLAVCFLAQNFSAMMHIESARSDAMMYMAYAFLKIAQRGYLIVFYHKETVGLRWETNSGKHGKAVEKLIDRARTTTYEDFAVLSSSSQPKH